MYIYIYIEKMIDNTGHTRGNKFWLLSTLQSLGIQCQQYPLAWTPDPNPPRNSLGNNLAQKCLGSWSSAVSVD